MNSEKLATVFIFIAIAAFFIIAGPLLLLWALNTLFPAIAIPYTFWTWCAAFLLSAPFVNRGKK
jgi:hypothetical protein